MKKLSPLVVLLVMLGCGDNLQSPAPVNSLNAPANLQAFSLSHSSIELQWSAPSGVSDSTFRGYIVEVGSNRDTIDKSQREFVATGLPPGESAFLVYSLNLDGLRSSAATVRWAPAARFDTAYTVYENNNPVSQRAEGFNIGSTLTDPSTMVIDPADINVQQTMDFYVNGGSQQIQLPLSMWSANLFIGSFNRTVFSTRTDASPSLDFALAAFPDESTFIKDTIGIVDNTIYYLKVVGDPGQFNYGRVHVHIKPGLSFPNRAVEIRVSLQRLPGLLYAFVSPSPLIDILEKVPSYMFIHRNHS